MDVRQSISPFFSPRCALVPFQQLSDPTNQVANEIGVPFLAVSGTHGWTDDISKIQDGIQIRMRGLNHVSISPSNDTAYVGGGGL
ncbi:hypothetical protein BJX99DRAFT_262688 [Aspergillus californicus]